MLCKTEVGEGGGAFPKARIRDSDMALYARHLIFGMLTTWPSSFVLHLPCKHVMEQT